MQSVENMAEVIKFVNVIIIFISLFPFAMTVDANMVICTQDFDCQTKICPFDLQPKCTILFEFLLSLCGCV
ncbi:putative Late nodulin [Medicago truncatula]|uniref:Putative Late nodulin n=1 Tax=Medicago truncatula TaxID=3880 RepID=A0A396I8Y9_MEDTR|nr:putative Late nodulin [Medicago truncatula]